MADDAPSPASSRSAANSKSPAAEGATDATVTQKEDKKQGVKARDNAGDENASGEEGGDDSKKKDGDDEEGGDEKEGDDDPAADDADKKSTQKKAAATPRKPTKRKSSGNLKGSGSSSGTPSAASKKVVREYKAEDLVLHKLKGYPPWPAVILSDEVAELKPDLVKTKPSGSSNKKGKSRNSIGGDGVTARTSYPVAYLHNFFEYSYAPISDLEPLTKEKMKEFAPRGKKKDLIDAYEIAKEGVTMDQLREAFTADPMAVDEEEEVEGEGDEEAEVEEEEAEEEEEEEEEAEEEDVKKKKGTKRKKSEGSDEEMEEPEKKPTKNPKRGSTAKTPTKAKTPKSVAKTPAKAPNGDAKTKTPAKITKKTPAKKETAAGKKSAKSKKHVAQSDEEEEAQESDGSTAQAKKSNTTMEEPAVVTQSPTDKKEQRKREILYIRHRLQKGLLTRGTVPSEAEMPQLANHFDTLEKFDDLEVSVIRSTKINKVLKMITKLSSIPQDETFKLRERSIALLEKVNQRLAEEPEEEHEGKSDDKQNGSEDTPSKEEKEKTNGASKHEKADEEAAANEKEAEKENSGKKDLKEVEMRDAPEPKAATATTAADEDTAMSE